MWGLINIGRKITEKPIFSKIWNVLKKNKELSVAAFLPAGIIFLVIWAIKHGYRKMRKEGEDEKDKSFSGR